MNEQGVAIREQTAIEGELSVAQVLAQVQKIQELMKAGMKENEHFGVIPGTNNKPTLLKPGAEKLCLMFRLAPDYESTERQDGDHLTIKSKCTLSHIPTGRRLGSGEGSCSTREVKYAYRHGSRKCPICGKEAIIKGKKEYGGGWLCFKKKDGCGAKFKEGDAAIEGQQVRRIPNEDLADQYNTVLKMANKRSLIAAVLNVTAASDIFTQDLEDVEDNAPAAVPSPLAKEEPSSHSESSPVTPPAAAGATDWRAEFNAATAKFLHHLAPNAFKRLLGEYGYEKPEQIPDRETAIKIYKTLELMVDQKTGKGQEKML